MLARGPQVRATRHTAYDINGYRFRMLDRERMSKTQNNGVAALALTLSQELLIIMKSTMT